MSLSKKSKKRIIIALVAIAAVLVGGYFYLYQSHQSINDMEVAFKGNSQEFLTKIEANADEWTTGGNKVVELTGVISGKDLKGVTVNGSIYFQLEEGTKTDALKEGQKINIKGRIIGYDEILEELKLDKAIILKK
ncbi:hypothetical protein [uncultured Kordia sp.]|uniref:hypothetical protein n=1 Tax=uncultured Kordia sp. TaxID=507699 RepID=UPI0026298277|nr:hypothetical protein [uncultured Kordia sp.]